MTRRLLLFGVTALAAASPAFAQDGGPISAVGLDTMFILMSAFLVFFMQAGFGLLEAGFIRAKNTCNILTKNFLDYCMASLGFFIFGYAIMFSEGNPLFGTSGFLLVGAGVRRGRSDLGVLAVPGGVLRGGGHDRGRRHGGADAVHRVPRLLVRHLGVRVSGRRPLDVGRRLARRVELLRLRRLHRGAHDRRASPRWSAPGSSAPGSAGTTPTAPSTSSPATRCRSRRSACSSSGSGGSASIPGPRSRWADGELISLIAINTNLAASAGALITTALSWVLYGKPDLFFTMNGALAGLVSITAPCAVVSPAASVWIGMTGGVAVIIGVRILDKLRIDDPCGAFPVHGLCGFWGTLTVGLWGREIAWGRDRGALLRRRLRAARDPGAGRVGVGRLRLPFHGTRVPRDRRGARPPGQPRGGDPRPRPQRARDGVLLRIPDPEFLSPGIAHRSTRGSAA